MLGLGGGAAPFGDRQDPRYWRAAHGYESEFFVWSAFPRDLENEGLRINAVPVAPLDMPVWLPQQGDLVRFIRSGSRRVGGVFAYVNQALPVGANGPHGDRQAVTVLQIPSGDYATHPIKCVNRLPFQRLDPIRRLESTVSQLSEQQDAQEPDGCVIQVLLEQLNNLLETCDDMLGQMTSERRIDPDHRQRYPTKMALYDAEALARPTPQLRVPVFRLRHTLSDRNPYFSDVVSRLGQLAIGSTHVDWPRFTPTNEQNMSAATAS
eukprot:TRINITY_DN26186_c0_g5_i1.p1 TRINITY_DN26186_c0_g5~~TRINITY_DN26186_c0_g5_i1.p1  ORF type:complete len:298 (+),score=43.08 TRINITY_DN26186_c0_g5_i1:100-894(+)